MIKQATLLSHVRLGLAPLCLCLCLACQSPDSNDELSGGEQPDPAGAAPDPAGETPDPAGAEPDPAGETPDPAGAEPSPAGAEPSPAGAEPSPAGTEPSPAGTEPSPAGTEPSPAGTEPDPAGTEPDPAGDEAGVESGGEEIIIEVAGTTAGGMEEHPPIDESVPGEGIHAFTMRSITGEEVDMRRYRGKVALVVNVASYCGYTSQYEGLQSLYEQYRDRGFVVLGFPANNFGNQEPGSEEDIAEFCTANFGVTFPMFTKISVVGEDIHPLYSYLTGESGSAVAWNFNKFLVDVDGHYHAHYFSSTTPLSAQLTSAIEALLPPQEEE